MAGPWLRALVRVAVQGGGAVLQGGSCVRSGLWASVAARSAQMRVQPQRVSPWTRPGAAGPACKQAGHGVLTRHYFSVLAKRSSMPKAQD